MRSRCLSVRVVGKKMEPKHALICGAYFGGFQALMPALGYLLGSQFESMITQDRPLDRLCASRDH